VWRVGVEGGCVCVCVCVCVCALRACCVGNKCLMSVRHVACASVWACAGQRYSTEDLPRLHTKSPLSTPAQRTSNKGEPRSGRCWRVRGEKEHPLTALQTAQGEALQCSESKPASRPAARPI
jgi:hypothetical protein